MFLADRNALIDQTKRGDFKHSKDKMTVIETIEELSVLRVEPLNKFGTQTEIINYFEGKLNTYKNLFTEGELKPDSVIMDLLITESA